MLDILIDELKDRLGHVRIIVHKENNTIDFTCLNQDQWLVAKNVLELFRGYPIVIGDFITPYSFVRVIEKLPSTEVKHLLPMVIDQDDIPF